MDTNISIEKIPLDLSQLEVAIEHLKTKQFSICDDSKINAFNVYKVAIDTIVEEKDSHNVVVAIGKEIKWEGKTVITLRNRYIINDDFSFGKWAVGNQTEKVEDVIISKLTASGFLDIGFNSEEIKDFLTDPYLVVEKESEKEDSKKTE